MSFATHAAAADSAVAGAVPVPARSVRGGKQERNYMAMWNKTLDSVLELVLVMCGVMPAAKLPAVSLLYLG